MARQRNPGLAVIAAFTVGLACGGSALAAPTSSFTLTGLVAAPGTYSPALLQALPATTETETFSAGGTPVSDSFTGPTLYGLLQAAGGITTDPTVKNDLLRTYVVATGSDGYEAVIASGEIAPQFGNKPDLVAYSDSLGQLPAPNGFARSVAAGDIAGGRYVSNLADLTVGLAPAQGGTGGGSTSQFTVAGGVAAPGADTLASLETLTPHTETVTYAAGLTPVTDTYTGALLWDVLEADGIVTDPSIKNDILRKLVSVTGSDGYQVDFSLGELDPQFGAEPVLVAYSDTAGQLAGGSGFARVVVPGDTAGGRYVSNIAGLSVFDATAVPEPESLALLMLGAVATAGLRRTGRDQSSTMRRSK